MTIVTISVAIAMAPLAIPDVARREVLGRQLERSMVEARHYGLRHSRKRTEHSADNTAATWRGPW